MKREQVIHFYPQLKVLLNLIRGLLLALLLVTVALYSLAFWLVYIQMPVEAVIVATLAFLLFRTLRDRTVIIAKYLLSGYGNYEEVLNFVDKESAGKSVRQFYTLLEKVIKLVKD
jgi:hypothetical protein